MAPRETSVGEPCWLLADPLLLLSTRFASENSRVPSPERLKCLQCRLLDLADISHKQQREGKISLGPYCPLLEFLIM